MKITHSAKKLALTIAPTLNCNFDCDYCCIKQYKKSLPMSQEVQNKVLQFVESNLSSIDYLSIEWCGGEALLALDIIERLSEKFIYMCKEKNVQYSASIVTNGYKLNRENAKRLKKIKVKYIQVTLDGPENIHNKRRPLVGGQPTFNEILRNISQALEIIKNIFIRINADIENINCANQLVEALDTNNLRNKVYVYLGYVEQNKNCCSSNKWLTIEGYTKAYYNFQNTLINCTFQKEIILKYPTLKGNECCGSSENNYIIDPKGYMYKRCLDLGIQEYSVGNILDDEHEQ